MEFKTSELSGILLSTAEPPSGSPSLSIEVYNGKVNSAETAKKQILNQIHLPQVIMSCDLGNGEPFRAETNFASKFSLCDNKWHNISALYDTHQVAIRIDHQPFVVAYASSRSIGKLQTSSALYIGGLPGKTSFICFLSEIWECSIFRNVLPFVINNICATVSSRFHFVLNLKQVETTSLKMCFIFRFNSTFCSLQTFFKKLCFIFYIVFLCRAPPVLLPFA